jgi:hypothetical protein
MRRARSITTMPGASEPDTAKPLGDSMRCMPMTFADAATVAHAARTTVRGMNDDRRARFR